jgi:hypothetical protein
MFGNVRLTLAVPSAFAVKLFVFPAPSTSLLLFDSLRTGHEPGLPTRYQKLSTAGVTERFGSDLRS